MSRGTTQRHGVSGRSRWRLLAGVLILAIASGVLLWSLLGTGDDQQGSDEAVSEFMHLHGLGIPDWAPDTVYVATHQGLLRIGEDGDWRRASEEPHDFMGFAVHPTDDGVLYTSGHPAPGTDLRNPVGFMVSEDHGRTWTPRALHGETDFHAMAVQATNGDVVYGFHGGRLYRSDDAGESWVTLDEAGALGDAGGALALAVHPDDADEVLAATQSGLVRMRDDGRDVGVLLGAPTTAVAFAAADPDRILAYAPEPGPGLVESTDGGESWQEVGLTFDEDAAGHIAVHPDDPQVVYVGTYGASLHRTVDGGATWERLAEGGVPQP